ncbi:MAG TPA: glycosyltransferase family 4 protein [Gordonia sp. (in: high G+C Gram-positive bacteria)]|uniref:glycosyltransferase family 4 protein n=1 Tax=unclassified Gordonia (in: high G+C Gram-positive bacteria) TaxID=2657482 RepID=UPI000F988CA1|nr:MULTISPECIES: glycosyltransferase family 4 protein [unclassified Gordonia (in: high G+C Gram-positive bacteria)]RTL08359.1 MAG: glycosyltransferase family 1 protein [Acidimicrobiia bacterium]HNP58050.1 glycosyltransferase family 4 protein [Gordonia sp. (in: high G+C Gram-positive bacteria)]HRC49947.1 glycosyltransferase family 4 protein [Gordonia sp. (in: high G+C Gram-positive bacteria)]
MKLLLVSWEYPPVVVGGLGRHVHNLAVALAELGHDVVVLTRRPTGTDATTHPTTVTTAEGVRIIAAAEDPPEFDFGSDMMPWTLAMGHAMVRAGLRVLRDDGTGQAWIPDVVHAHDWLVAHPAVALAEFYDVPLVATIHATEAGRHSGWVAAKTNRQVHSVEWWLAREADALITCSTSMRDEVNRLFGPELAEIQVIHNGIAVEEWPHRRLEESGTVPSDGPAELLFAGRLEYEKGVQDLLAALPRIRRTHPGTTLTIAGSGTQLEWLLELARKHRVVGAVTFRGSVDRAELIELMHRSAAIVLPSRYEPFGIVALEAAATGVPLVVSTAGGLGEAVTDTHTGMTFPPADVTALAAAVRTTLDDPEAAAQRARRAFDRLTEEFSWRTVAERTTGVYVAAKRRVRHPIGRPNIVERPLPERDPNQPIT